MLVVLFSCWLLLPTVEAASCKDSPPVNVSSGEDDSFLLRDLVEGGGGGGGGLGDGVLITHSVVSSICVYWLV